MDPVTHAHAATSMGFGVSEGVFLESRLRAPLSFVVPLRGL